MSKSDPGRHSCRSAVSLGSRAIERASGEGFENVTNCADRGLLPRNEHEQERLSPQLSIQLVFPQKHLSDRSMPNQELCSQPTRTHAQPDLHILTLHHFSSSLHPPRCCRERLLHLAETDSPYSCAQCSRKPAMTHLRPPPDLIRRPIVTIAGGLDCLFGTATIPLMGRECAAQCGHVGLCSALDRSRKLLQQQNAVCATRERSKSTYYPICAMDSKAGGMVPSERADE